MIARIDQDDTLPLDQVVHGECLSVMRSFPDNSVDSIVCDPPAGISFMSKKWDAPDHFPLRDRGERLTGSGNPTESRGFANGVTFDSTKKGRDTFIAWLAEVMAEALRCLKPGGHALVWSLPRTSHWTGLALEQAGFEMRDCLYHTQAQDSAMAAFEASLTETQHDALARLIDSQEAPSSIMHIFATGFPKSLSIGKAIHKQLGIEREVVGQKMRPDGKRAIDARPNGFRGEHEGWDRPWKHDREAVERQASITAPSPELQQYEQLGSALKPACENWWLCRKPLSEKTLALNVLKWHCGGLNIDKSRVGSDIGYTQEQWDAKGMARTTGNTYGEHVGSSTPVPSKRFPSNVLFSHSLFCTDTVCDASCPVLALEQQSGVRKSGGRITQDYETPTIGVTPFGRSKDFQMNPSTGTASRFFHCFTPDAPFLYASKASRSERSKGCEGIEEKSPWTSFDGQYAKGRNPVTGERSEHEYKREQSNSHPCVKSQYLMKYLVSLITPDNGIVLDMFAGSGSTLVAAIAEGYHFIGIEALDTPQEPYCTIARARIAHALRGET